MTNTNRELSNQDLMQLAPSIFATEPWLKMSDRYAFIPTIDVVNRMRDEGFMPYSAGQSRTRIEGKAEFTKHLIRFRQPNATPIMGKLGNLIPEVVLINSHDGASAYNLMGGLFRCARLNGLVVSEDLVTPVKVRHSGNPDGIIEASYQVIEQFPKVLESAERFSQLRLEAPQRVAYAEAALALRYDDGEAPIDAGRLLQAKRRDDQDPTLWNTFNTVQEHMVQGGLRGRNPGTRRRMSTRAVTGISENTRLNKALWMLTEKMATLVA